MTRTNTLLALLLLPTFGCVTDEPDELTTEQAVSSTNMGYFECGSDCFEALGTTANNRACFLGGVYGALGDGGAAEIIVSGGSYYLSLTAGAGSRIAAKTVCVTGGTNRDFMQWTSGNPFEQRSQSSASRHCFLKSISGIGTVAFNDTIDYVHTWKNGSTWYLGGQITGGATVHASAVCIDTPLAYGWSGVAVLGDDAGGDLISNAAGGWACGLAKLGGKFTSSSYGDKVEVDYDATAKQWTWTLVNGKQAEAVCIK
jgi:hypothetical protein